VSTTGQRAATESERLRRIDSVTDAALMHLDVQDLLVVLLERVREIFDVDTAAVLLHDPATDDLVATATSGLEQEVRQGVRVPMGQGFAGRVAAEATPVVIEDVDQSDVPSPILKDRGIKTLVGVPLVSESRVIGVLQLGSQTPRRFAPVDLEFIQLVADRVALAIVARRSNVERAAASALQRSLIPDRLPTVPGLELAGRYLPAGAGGVGGDWYDVFTLPSGRVGVVMGDVIGRGLPAAVVMGRLRSALRAYALDTVEPGIVLERLDRKLQHFEAGQMTTVLYGVLDPELTTLQVSSAGHPLPMTSVPGGEVGTIDAVVDPPLGVDSGIQRRTTTIPFAPGAMLALFTDGLVERRDEPITEGLDRLRSALGTGTAEQRCAEVIHTMFGGAEPQDDVALLVLHREDDGDNPPLHLRVPAVATSLGLIRAGLRRWLAGVGVGDKRGFDVLLGVGEAAANAVAHAYGPGGGAIAVEVSSTDGVILATIRDTGTWRLPRGENRGRGITIMEGCADEMTVDTTDAGTEVRLTFRNGGDQS
jgi:GAF domain-containing protein